MKKIYLVLSLTLLVSFTCTAQLLQWNTFNNSGNETFEPSVFNDPNISASNLTLGAGITSAVNANRFGGSNWFNTGNTNPNILSEAVAGNNYIEFIVTPTSGFTFTPASLVFNWDKSGTGPTNVALRSSEDGFAANLGTIVPTASIGSSNTITISGLNNLSNATTFRVYGYGATATGGTGGFDVGTNTINVTLNGTTSAAVPPVKLAVTNIVPASPTPNTAFSVTVRSQEPGNSFSNVLTATDVILSTNGNAGTIGGTITGTIAAGSNTLVISGVTLSTTGTGVTITATRTAGDNLTPGTSASFNVVNTSNATDYFRSSGSGNWNAAGSWESSHDNSFWFPATAAPTSAASAVAIRNGQTITLTANASARSLTVEAGGTLTNTDLNGGYLLTIADASGVDLKVYGVYEIFGIQPAFLSSATAEIYSGGIVRASNNTNGESDDFARNNNVLFLTDAIFDWNTTNTFQFSGFTYFPNALSNIAIFRISITPGTPGGGSPGVINGILEVNANVTFIGGSSKTFRNGISGSNILTQNNTASNSFNLTAANAILGGSSLRIVLNSPLNLSTSTTVTVGSNVTISGANINNSGGTLYIDGSLDVTTIQITNSSGGTVFLNGTYRTAHLGGFTGTSSSIPSGTVNINNLTSTPTVEYYASLNQLFTPRSDYYNIKFSTGGTKTPSVASPTSISGTVTISDGTVVDVSNNTFGGSTTKLVMTGTSKFINEGSGVKPDMGGTYTLGAGTTIEFSGSSATDIRLAPSYYNVIVNGDNVSTSSLTTSIKFQPGGKFTVKAGKKFKVNNTAGFSGGTTTSIDNSNSPAIVLEPLSIIEYSSAGDQVITNQTMAIPVNAHYEHLYVSGTGNKTAPTDLKINGDLIKSSTSFFSHNNGLVSFTGTVPQVYNSNAPGLTFFDLQNNNVSGLTFTAEASIEDILTLGNSSITNVNSHVNILSGNGRTAQIDKIPSSAIINYNTGKFNIERYIPNHSKAWQFLAVPLHEAESIKAAWQENGSPLPNYGTYITSNINGAGFDMISGNGPSLKTYNIVSNGWDGVPNTTDTIGNRKGYMLFVRGDRTATSFNSPTTSTTLRARGKIFYPSFPPPAVIVQPGKFESVGNPYASAIDFSKLTFTGDVDTSFYVWDPKLTTIGPNSAYGLGGYQNFIWNGSAFIITPGGGSYTTGNTQIESGQAFFVHSAGAGGNISFTENAKVSGSNLVTRGGFTGTDPEIFIKMFGITAAGPVLLDGARSHFGNRYSAEVDGYDAIKLNNTGENLSIINNGIKLIVERRALVNDEDTIFYQLNYLKQQPYLFKIIPDKMDTSNLHAWMVDTYLNNKTSIPLDGESSINFTVNSDPLSYSPGRFYLVLKRIKPIITPVNSELASIYVSPNPVIHKNINLHYKELPAANYTVKLINTAGQVILNLNLPLQGNGSKIINVSNLAAGVYIINIISGRKLIEETQVIIQ